MDIETEHELERDAEHFRQSTDELRVRLRLVLESTNPADNDSRVEENRSKT